MQIGRPPIQQERICQKSTNQARVVCMHVFLESQNKRDKWIPLSTRRLFPIDRKANQLTSMESCQVLML